MPAPTAALPRSGSVMAQRTALMVQMRWGVSLPAHLNTTLAPTLPASPSTACVMATKTVSLVMVSLCVCMVIVVTG